MVGSAQSLSLAITESGFAMNRLIQMSPLLLGLTWASPGVQAQGDACFSDWAAAAIVIKAESLMTVEELTQLAPSKLAGNVVRTSLCENDRGFIYKLVIKDKSGQIKLLTVDAKSPFPR